jgi:hypothetical protein
VPHSDDYASMALYGVVSQQVWHDKDPALA